jgi:PAS domain S-box-containing protein
VRASVTPVIKGGDLEYFVGVFDNISVEVALREQDREKQTRLDTIMEHIPLSITLTDENGRFTFVNRQAELNLQMDKEAILSKSITELFPREGKKALQDIRKVFRTKKPGFGQYSYHLQGKENYFEIQRLPLLDGDGRVTQVMSISANFTRQKYEEKVLKIQQTIDSLQSIGETFEESLRVLFENLFELDWIDGGGIYIIDQDTQSLRLVHHRGLSATFARSVESYPFDSPNAQAVLNGQPRYARPAEFLDPSRNIQNDEKITFIAVLPLVYHNTVVGSLNLASRAVSGIDEFNRQAIETIARKIANLMDVINTREELTRANEVLAKNLHELREKQDLLIQKSKLESLGEMSAGLAHEISQPLSVISLAFENILYKLQENQAHSEYFTRKSATINLNIDKIRQLIDHIRIFSRDQSSVMFEKVDANQAIRNTLAMTSVQLHRHHIFVHLSLDEEGCPILGNLTKMEQVIMNLVSNARDAVNER